MEPEHIRFGGGAAETILHPIVAVWLLIAIVLILVLPRKLVITPFLLAFFTIPVGQVVLVGGVHFTCLRILILAGLARMAISGMSSSGGTFAGGFNPVDKAVLLWTVSALAIISLQWMDSQALVKNLGEFLDALGGYSVIRFLIPDGEAIRRAVKGFAAVCAIQGAFMINEQITHQNVFGLLGGMPIAATIRDGHIRSQGVMGCIYAGVFAGILIPLFVWLWTEGEARVSAFAGLAGAMAIVITSYSSTSWLACAGSLAGLAFWPVRKRMRLFRWGFALVLVTLHLVMHGPVWSLIARMDLTGSSSGYHRYYLVDKLIQHFSDWWLLGFRNYNDWGWDMWDTCNQFVDVALKGGLLTLILYILILKRSFGAVGNARKLVSGDRKQEWFLWCLGSALFANVVAAFGINYMAQLLMLLFPLLACISVATFEVQQAMTQGAETSNSEELALAPSPAGASLPLSEAQKNRFKDFPV